MQTPGDCQVSVSAATITTKQVMDHDRCTERQLAQHVAGGQTNAARLRAHPGRLAGARGRIPGPPLKVTFELTDVLHDEQYGVHS